MARSSNEHPALLKLRKLAASFPQTKEVEAWGHPTFRAGEKIFASFGEHEEAPVITVKQTLDTQADLTASPGFYVPPYVGRHGWVGIRVDEVPWPVIADLIETSYRMVARKHMVRALDDRICRDPRRMG